MIHPLSDVRSASIGKNTKVWQFCVIAQSVVIGDDCNICSHCFIEDGSIIGNNVTIKNNVSVWAGTIVEDNVFIGPGATFTNDAWPLSGNREFRREGVLVEAGASLGANCTILPGVKIGAGAMVGAGSVVERDIPPFTVSVGNPARVIRIIEKNNFSGGGHG